MQAQRNRVVVLIFLTTLSLSLFGFIVVCRQVLSSHAYNAGPTPNVGLAVADIVATQEVQIDMMGREIENAKKDQEQFAEDYRNQLDNKLWTVTSVALIISFISALAEWEILQ